MNFTKVRVALVKILLATLIAAAAVAVGVILLGSVNDIMGRVIWTLVAAIFYVLVLLAIISTVSHIGEGPRSRSSLFLVNSVLALACASYLTSILSIWGVINGNMPGKLHLAYLVFLFGILYAKPLIDLEQTQDKLKKYIQANYVFIGIACVLTAVAIVCPNEWHLWDSLLGRSIAAAVVIAVTLSMIITVLYHLDTQQNRKLRALANAQAIPTNNATGVPVVAAPPPSRPASTLQIVLWALLGVFVGLPALGVLISMVLAIIRLAAGGTPN